MKRKLTAKAIESLPPGKLKRYEVWDELLPGFGVRVSERGRKSWFVVGRCNGKQLRHTIGTFPALTLSEAREAGRSVLGSMQLGTYTTEEKRPPLTLGETVPMFIAKYARPKNRQWKDTERVLQKFEPLFGTPLSDVRRGDVAQILDSIVEAGTPYRANRALSAIKTLFAWALDRGLIEYHPLVRLKKPAKEQSRDRVLTDRELRALWFDCDANGYPFGPLFQLLVLTGQRRTEVAEMRWSELNLEERTWRISPERAKNGRAHTLPLSSTVLGILEELPQFEDCDFVFTTTGQSAISGFGHYKARMDRRLGFSDWRPHDLRRTAASGSRAHSACPTRSSRCTSPCTG